MKEKEMIDVSVTSSFVIITASIATTISKDILRVQKFIIVRVKERSQDSFNHVRSKISQRRQQAFEESTQRTRERAFITQDYSDNSDI